MREEHNNYIIYLIVRDRWGWHQHVSLPDGGDEQGETGTQIHINVSFPIQYLSSSIHILKFQKTAIQQRKDPSCGACASYNSISLTKFLRPSVHILIQLSSQHLTGLWSNMRMTVGSERHWYNEGSVPSVFGLRIDVMMDICVCMMGGYVTCLFVSPRSLHDEPSTNHYFLEESMHRLSGSRVRHPQQLSGLLYECTYT